MRERVLSDIPADLAKLQPYGDFVLVKRLPSQEVSASIWLPQETVRDMNTGVRRGVVMATGPGDKLWERWTHYKSGQHPKEFWPLEHSGKRCEMDVKVGDEVLYPRTPANEVKLNGEEYCFIHEGEIRAVLETEPSRMEQLFGPPITLKEGDVFSVNGDGAIPEKGFIHATEIW